MLRGIANYVHHHRPWSFVWEPGGLDKAWPRIDMLELDGIILRDVDKVNEVIASHTPAVVIGHGRKEVSSLLNVVTDSERIGLMAAEHLLACGFRRFAFCGAGQFKQEIAPWAESRQHSFSERVQKAGWPCANFPISTSGRESWERERRRMIRWLQSLPKPVGLMAANDDRAQQVVEACKAADIHVPSEVGVIGVDNDEVVCGLSDPPLSSVAVNFDRAGYEAAAALECLMEKRGAVPERILVHPTHIVVRRSTDVVAVEDQSVARALRYIRGANVGQDVTVAMVARQAGVSRRVLEKRFRRVIGCSVLDEIRRMNTDRMARMLVETQLSVKEIAETLGFDDLQHFARYFRSVKKLSPLAYRKAYAAHSVEQRRSHSGDFLAQSGVVR